MRGSRRATGPLSHSRTFALSHRHPMAAPKAKPKSTTPNVREADAGPELIPARGKACEVKVGGRSVRLTNLHKPFWPELGITKGDLLRYYLAVSPFLLPHLRGRAM